MAGGGAGAWTAAEGLGVAGGAVAGERGGGGVMGGPGSGRKRSVDYRAILARVKAGESVYAVAKAVGLTAAVVRYVMRVEGKRSGDDERGV